MNQTMKERPKLMVRSTELGGGNYTLCVPLPDKEKEGLLKNAKASLKFCPDMFEWRVDGFGKYPDPVAVRETLSELRQVVGDCPILFTPRHIAEGGEKDISDEEKFQLIDSVSQSGQIDLLDIELRYGEDILCEWKEKLQSRNVSLVISYHDFDTYIQPEITKEILKKEQEWGADVCKIITKVDSCQDLVDFSEALFEARREFLHVPVIAGVIGNASPLMRVLGDFLGSDLTFVTASGSPSHPTQLHIQQVREIRKRVQNALCE